MSVLVISVHPDDETLGCGGTLLKHRTDGEALFWLIVTRAHEPRWPREVVERKGQEVELVAQAYGVERCIQLDFPALHLHSVSQVDLIERIGSVVKEVRPGLVYLVHGGDVHTDHQIVFTLAMAVLKPSYMSELGVHRVLCYETLSSTEASPPLLERAFVPNVFSDITPYMDRKVEIMGLYGSELQADPRPRTASAIRALGRYRGASVGVEYAEAFMLIRELTGPGGNRERGGP